MCVKLSLKDLNPAFAPPTIFHKYLYLWSDHRTKCTQWLTCHLNLTHHIHFYLSNSGRLISCSRILPDLNIIMVRIEH